MKGSADEDRLLSSTAFQNAQSIHQARQRAEDELVRANEALEARAQELLRSVSTLRATLQSTTDAILVTGAGGERVDHNEKLAQIWGLPPERLALLDKEGLWRSMAEQTLDAPRCLARLAEIEVSPLESFDQIDLADGRVLELFSTIQVVENTIVGRVWSFRDVTERKFHEAALRASHAQFSAIIHPSPVGILLVDSQLRLRQVNPKALPLLGDLDPVIGREIGEIVGRVWGVPSAGEILERFRHTQTTGESYVRRGFSSTRSDIGAEEHYDWELHQVTLPDGRHGVVCYLFDITDHVRAQEALRSSEQRERESGQRLQLALSAGHLGDWSWDAASDQVSLGGRAAQCFGLQTSAAISWGALSQLLHPDDRERSRAAVETALRERSDYDVEYRLDRPAGDEVWIAAKGRGVYASDGAAVGMIGVVQDVSERKKLEVVQRRLAAVVESSDDAILSKDLDGTVRTWNKGAERIFGYTEQEMVGQPILRLIPPELREEERSILDRQRRGERIDHYETVRVTKDGRRIDVSLTVSPIRDASGRIVGASKVARDITARKRIDAELRRSEEELRALADSIPQLSWMANADGHIFWFNRGWYEYTGTTLEQMEGWGWQSVHDPDVLPRVLERWSECLRTGEPFEMEFPLRGADGSFRWFLTRSRPIRDAGGAIVRWFGTNTDVDEVKRAREALGDESRLLNLLNETGQSIAADLDLETLVQGVTDATTQLSGAEFGAFFYNTQDAGGDSYRLFTLSGAEPEAFAKFGQPRATPLFAPTFNGEGPVRIHDVLTDERYGQWAPDHGMPQGHLPVRSYMAVPVVSRSGEVIGGLFFGHSTPGVFTERIERVITGIAAQAAVAIDNARLYERVKRAAEERQELLEAERSARSEAERVSNMKDEFLATLSHELRTPLNAIVGWSQLLRMRGHADAEVIEGLTVIDRNARVQAQLIEDLLDMSRIISGKVRLDVQRVDIQDVVGASIAAVRPSADSKNIRIQALVDPQAGPVWGDPSRLQQCFWNLLSNAIKFTPKGGRVQVTLTRVDSSLEFTVVDDGQGIAPEFLPHVFERFRQADSSTTRYHGGLGLGLSIVKSLVELHGGVVSAESPGTGQGATFRIELPVMVVGAVPADRRREHPAGRPTPAGTLDHPSLEGITVLTVDDEPDARGLVKRVLEECGARVFVAASAQAGLEILMRERPDILISDIGMPNEDGYTLIRQVRQLAPELGGRIPAAALSAFARPEDRTRALRSGYQMHLSKPVEPTELTAVVASLASRR